jgi:hypothetical protein
MNTYSISTHLSIENRCVEIAVCPLCGHTATVVDEGIYLEVYCPDKYCPNCQDKPNE